MEIKELLLEKNLLDQQTEGQFNDVHIMECEEVLDNLGYIVIEDHENEGHKKVSTENLLKGIKKFRLEYKLHKNKFNKDYNIAEKIKDEYLTEEELEFFEELCSLEGKFKLHEYIKEEIKENPILIRVLNFRLKVLSILTTPVNSYYFEEAEFFIERIGSWCGESDYNTIMEYLGNIELLSIKLIEQENYKNSKFKHTIYFKNDVNTKAEKVFRFTNDLEQFKSRFIFYFDSSKNAFHDTGTNKKRIESIINDDFNKLMIRLVQLRFWLLGLYQGKLDSDLGSLSLNAIQDALDLYESSHGNTKGFSINDIITYLNNDNWAINSVFLFKGFLIHLGKAKNKKDRVETINEELQSLYQGLNCDDKDKFIVGVKDLISEKDQINRTSKIYRKTKARGVQQLYRSISRFFRRITYEIKKVGKKVIDIILKKLRALFNWIKNGINILIRELKKVFKLLSAGVEFFFSKRVVESGNENANIKGDFNFDFDNVTVLDNYNSNLLQEQTDKYRYVATAMEEVAEFLGTVVHIIIKVASGPYGWLKLAIELIKWLAKNKFQYNRFSFN